MSDLREIFVALYPDGKAAWFDTFAQLNAASGRDSGVLKTIKAVYDADAPLCIRLPGGDNEGYRTDSNRAGVDR